MSRRITVFKPKMEAPLFWKEFLCTFLSLSDSCTHNMWPEIDMRPLPEGSELIWYTVAYLLSWFLVDFLFYNAAGVEQAAGKSWEGKECVTSQRAWLLMYRYMRKCWGALKLKSDARLSTQLGFKEAGRVVYCWDSAIDWESNSIVTQTVIFTAWSSPRGSRFKHSYTDHIKLKWAGMLSITNTCFSALRHLLCLTLSHIFTAGDLHRGSHAWW